MGYLYFRNQADQDNDDSTGDSAVFPYSSLMGMQPTANTTLTLYFKSMLRRDPTGAVDEDASLDNHDSVQLTITAHRHKEVMKAIAQNANKSFVVVADDVTTTYLTGTNTYTGAAEDETVTAEVLHSDISQCGTITVAAAYANE